MPQPVEYVNLRATLPGEHKPNSVRKCGAYKFVGGVFEVRVPEKVASKIHAVLSTYYGSTTEDVQDEAVSEKGKGSKSSPAKVAKASGSRSKRAGSGTKKAAADKSKPADAETGASGSKTASADGQGSANNSDKSDASNLV